MSSVQSMGRKVQVLLTISGVLLIISWFLPVPWGQGGYTAATILAMATVFFSRPEDLPTEQVSQNQLLEQKHIQFLHSMGDYCDSTLGELKATSADS